MLNHGFSSKFFHLQILSGFAVWNVCGLGYIAAGSASIGSDRYLTFRARWVGSTTQAFSEWSVTSPASKSFSKHHEKYQWSIMIYILLYIIVIISRHHWCRIYLDHFLGNPQEIASLVNHKLLDKLKDMKMRLQWQIPNSRQTHVPLGCYLPMQPSHMQALAPSVPIPSWQWKWGVKSQELDLCPGLVVFHGFEFSFQDTISLTRLESFFNSETLLLQLIGSHLRLFGKTSRSKSFVHFLGGGNHWRQIR